MASRDLVTFESGKYKRRVSASETLDFLSIKIGATGLEIKETSGAFDFSAKELKNIANASADTSAPGWGQVKQYVGEQVISGGTVKQQLLTEIQLIDALGILPGLVAYIDTNAVENDTVVLKDIAGNTETFTFKNTPSTTFEVAVGGSAAISMSNLAAKINSDSVYWKAWYDTTVLDSLYTNGLLGIYRKNAVGTNAAFKVWKTGTVAGFVTDYHSQLEYKTNTSLLIALPSSEPSTALSGFSIAKADLTNGEIHNCIAEDRLKQWNADYNEGAGTWFTLAESVVVATSGSGGAILGKATYDSDKGIEVAGIGAVGLRIDNSTIEFDSATGANLGQIRIKADGVTKTHINSDIAGDGLGQDVDGSLKVNVTDGIVLSSDAVKVNSRTVTGANIATVVDVSSNGVAVRVDSSTISENGSNQLYVPADGITKTQINSDVAGAGLGQNVDGSLEVNAGNGLQLNVDNVEVKSRSVTGANIATVIDVTSDGVSVKVDSSTIAENGSNQLYVPADGITKTQINSDVAGDGLGQDVDGSLKINVSDGIALSADAIKVDARTATGANIATVISVTSNGVAVKIDDSTIGENGSNQLYVKASGITVTELANDSVTKDKVNADVAGAGLVQNLDGSLEVNAGNGIVIDTDTVKVNSRTATGANLATVIDVSSDGVAVRVDSSTIAENGSNQLYIPADGVTKTQINSDVAGDGLGQDVDGSLKVNAGDGIVLSADTVKVNSRTATGANLATVIDVTSNGVAVKIDNSTIAENGSNQLYIPNGGITETQLNASIAGDGLAGGGGSALSVNTGDAIKIATDAVAVDWALTKTNDNAGSITVRQVVYVKPNGNVDLAQATVTGLVDAEIGLVEATTIATTASGKITFRRGAVVGGFTGLTPGKLQYVSRATAGALTESLAGWQVGEFVYSVGRAISSTEILFNPGEIVLEY